MDIVIHLDPLQVIVLAIAGAWIWYVLGKQFEGASTQGRLFWWFVFMVLGVIALSLPPCSDPSACYER